MLQRIVIKAGDNYTHFRLAHEDYHLLQEDVEQRIDRWKTKELHGRYPSERKNADYQYTFTTSGGDERTDKW